ncbi:YpoC family protein [Niallia sp. Krafla_26]|uniref:YpoC family protein n=1 Tax=Niallia sp. Krafla_26 TaxID=3064703 RepID=UPI003D180D6F
MNRDQPWTLPNETVPFLFSEWNHLKMELQEGFTKRDLSRTEIPMKKGIELFLKALYWSNLQSVNDNMDSMDRLTVKPINIRERLAYIIKTPNKFHSFIQLSELFVEMEKLFRKQQALMDAKQYNKK